jgi:hypothetical protein
MTSTDLTFIVASQLPLRYYSEQLPHLKQDRSSPWFNLFAEFGIGNLVDEEVEELCKLSDIAFGSEEKTWIKQFAGGNPFKLQIACHTMYELKSRPERELVVTKAEFDRFISEASGTLQAEDTQPKSRTVRKIVLVVLTISLLVLVPLVGVLTRTMGTFLDNLANILVGLVVVLLLVLVLSGKLPVDTIREYTERILGIEKD